MKNLLILFCLASGLLVAGCANDFHQPVKGAKNPSSEEMSAARAKRAELIGIYQSVNGKWEDLTPEQRQRVIELSGGSESMAMRGWPALERMKP